MIGHACTYTSTIRSRRQTTCYVCGAQGKELYKGLTDRLFNAPGLWNVTQCSDPNCGVLWLDPMPLIEDISKAYKTYYTHQNITTRSHTLRRGMFRLAQDAYLAYAYGYACDHYAVWKQLIGLLLSCYPGWRVDIESSVLFLKAQRNARLLDVGCGSGNLLEAMQQRGWQVEGVDLDATAVEQARRKGLQVCLGSLEEAHFSNEYFDAITMSHLIEHVHDPLQLLRESYRILKPGGRLVIVTPNARSWGHSLYKEAWRGLEPPRHLYIFTPQALSHLVKQTNFNRLRVKTDVHLAPGIFVASKIIKQAASLTTSKRQYRILRVWGRFMQMIEWMILKFHPDIGEVIVLIAEKDAFDSSETID